LFIETEYIEDRGAILATRRPRETHEQKIWAAHLAVVEGETIGAPEIETDRARFLGRGRSLRSAAAMVDGAALSGTVGTVLDPVFALRRRVRVAAGATATVTFWTMIAQSREEVLSLVEKHRDAAAFGRVRALAAAAAQQQLRHLGIGQDDASFMRRPRCVPHPTESATAPARNRGCGSWASPGICRLCCFASRRRKTWMWRISCCNRWNTGA
jgi:cyclic beta-1,2-glucan synthetase